MVAQMKTRYSEKKDSDIIQSISSFIVLEYIQYWMKIFEYKTDSKTGARSVRLNQTKEQEVVFLRELYYFN